MINEPLWPIFLSLLLKGMPRLHRAAESSMSEGVDAETIPTTEEEEMLDPIQLSLFLDEESDV